MGWVGSAIEAIKAARPKRVWPLATSLALAGLLGLLLLSRLPRRRDPHYQRIADYTAGRTLWTEAMRAYLDAAKVFVLLVPAVAAVTITVLADVFDPSSVDVPWLLYLGWAALAVSWFAALLMLYSGRQIVHAVGLHLIFEHFDPKLSDSHLERSHHQSSWARRWMLLMYPSAFVGLGLVASFVGVNIGEAREEEVAREAVVTDLRLDRVDEDSVEVGLGLRLPGDGQLYTGCLVVGDEILAQTALVSDPAADETRSLSFRLDEVDPSAQGAFYIVPASLQLDISEPGAVEAIRANFAPLVEWSVPKPLPTPWPGT